MPLLTPRPLTHPQTEYPSITSQPSSSHSDFQAIQSRLRDLHRVVSHARLLESSARNHADEIRRDRLRHLGYTMSQSPISESRRRMRSVLRRIRETDETPNGRRSESPGASAPSAPPSDRRRPLPSERYQRLGEQRLRRVRRFFENDRSPRDNLQDLQEASERLAQSNEDLRNMLNRPISQTPSTQQPPVEPDDDNESRRKRRRTDSWVPGPPIAKIEYGYKGQVVSGQLKMELVHSDGDNMRPSSGMRGHWSGLNLNDVENILSDDTSVYSAGSRRCNIVLQHPNERPFTLDKIVIKANSSISTEALLEGLVFVSMQKDATFDRTTQYQIHHYPTSQLSGRRSVSRSSDFPLHNPTPSIRRTLPDMRSLRQAANISGSTSTQRRQTQHPDCDLSSDSSDGEEETGTSSPPRLGRHIVYPASIADSDTESETSSTTSPDEGAPLQSAGGATRARINLPDEEEDDEGDADYENVVAQYDFDEVLRRGNAVAQDRRRRRRAFIRERVQRQREIRERAAGILLNGGTDLTFNDNTGAAIDNTGIVIDNDGAVVENARDVLDNVRAMIDNDNAAAGDGNPDTTNENAAVGNVNEDTANDDEGAANDNTGNENDDAAHDDADVEDDNDGAMSGAGSDLPGEEERVLSESRALVDSVAAETSGSGAARAAASAALEGRATEPVGTHNSSLRDLFNRVPPGGWRGASADYADEDEDEESRAPVAEADFELLPVTASFTAATHTSGPLLARSRTTQHPGAQRHDNSGPTTPNAGIRVVVARRNGGRRIAVKFDPPVAARYILLKLWKAGPRGRADGEPYGGGSLHASSDTGVEVERVRVEGWCGPRFSLANEMA